MLNGTISAANDWTILTNGTVANSYTLGAINVSAAIASNTVIGKLSLTLPSSASGASIVDLTDATLGAANSPARSLT